VAAVVGASVLVGLAPPSPLFAAPPTGPRVEVIAGNGRPGTGLGRPTGPVLDGPTGVAVGPDGDLFIADTGNCRVLEVPGALAAPGAGRARPSLRVVAGAGCGGAGGHRGATATGAGIGAAQGVAVDAAGDLFVADTSGNRVLEVPATTTTGPGRTMVAGHVYPVAGEGLDAPQGLAVDSSGDLFIADTGHCRVAELARRSGTSFGVPVSAGGLFTVAGSGSCGTIAGAGVATGDGGPALDAVLWTPTALTLDRAGDLFIADRGNDSLREVAASSGTYYGVHIAADDIGTVAGSGSGYGPYLVDGLSATGPTAGLNFVSGVAVDGAGNLFVADLYDRAVREVAAQSGSSFGRAVTGGDLYTLVGAVPTGPTQDQTRWVVTRVTYPSGVAVAPSGAVVFSDRGANVVRVVVPPGA